MSIMSKNNPSSTLASFATLKSLCDEKKYQSPYQILREFIRYIVITEHLYSFSTAEMNSLLQKHFGFTIPEAVIRSSLKHTEGISLEDKIYSVTMNAIEEDSVFEEKRNEATAYESCIIHQLSEFIFEKTGKRAHIHRAGENPALALPAVLSSMKHIHIRDCKGEGPSPGAPIDQACGRGDIDLYGYFKAMVDAAYNGPVSLEVIGPDQDYATATMIAAESYGYMNAILKQLGAR